MQNGFYMSRPTNPAGPPPSARRGKAPGTKNRVVADIRLLCQSYGPDVVEKLWDIVNDKDASHKDVITAGRELLDRGFGRPTQPISGDPDKPPIDFRQKIDWGKVPTEVLRGLINVVAEAQAAEPKARPDGEEDGA